MKSLAFSAFFCLSSLVSLAGCKFLPSATTPSQQSPDRTQFNAATHRFENVSPTGSLGVALDTTTGQWCRTWDWDYKASTERNDLNTLPLCRCLYQSTLAKDERGKKIDPSRLKSGDVIDGYRYMGADPTDKNHWEKAITTDPCEEYRTGETATTQNGPWERF